jgi:hypothetical protein
MLVDRAAARCSVDSGAFDGLAEVGEGFAVGFAHVDGAGEDFALEGDEFGAGDGEVGEEFWGFEHDDDVAGFHEVAGQHGDRRGFSTVHHREHLVTVLLGDRCVSIFCR